MLHGMAHLSQVQLFFCLIHSNLIKALLQFPLQSIEIINLKIKNILSTVTSTCAILRNFLQNIIKTVAIFAFFQTLCFSKFFKRVVFNFWLWLSIIRHRIDVILNLYGIFFTKVPIKNKSKLHVIFNIHLF